MNGSMGYVLHPSFCFAVLWARWRCICVQQEFPGACYQDQPRVLLAAGRSSSPVASGAFSQVCDLAERGINHPSARELKPQQLETPLAQRAFGCNLNINASLRIHWPEPPILCKATHCSRTMSPVPCLVSRTSGGHLACRGLPSAAKAFDRSPHAAPAPQPLC